MTPLQWKNETIGKSFDVDSAYGAQCWDYFAYFVKHLEIPVSTYCALTGYVCDLWRLKDKYGYSNYFDYITDYRQLQDGDWCIWDKGSSHPYSHIAIFMSPNYELGQNQGASYVNEKTTDFSDIMGALRWKGWSEIKVGASDITINDHSYSLYRQNPKTEQVVVLSAGLNKVASIRQLDADAYVMAKATGANYFQMRTDQADPLNTTYGDLSSPLNDVWTEVPNQDSTLYFDVETGMFGDCTGIHVNPEHNVFSPAVVYPQSGNYQYARMVGVSHVNTVSRYSFVIRFTDGTYAIGIANQDSTPKQIATDFRTLPNLQSISFLDGGGSAQFGRWNSGKFEYVRDTGREVPSAVAIVSNAPYSGNEPVEEPMEPSEPEVPDTDEDEDMSENNGPILEPSKDENWTDPEATLGKTLLDTINSLLSVKSLVTLALTVCFIILSLRGVITSEQFMNIFTVCISFFFGYQFEKRNNQNGS